MQGYLSQVRHLRSRFESFSLLHIPRSENTHVDFLATLATSLAQSLPQIILIEDLCKPTEVKGEVVHVHQVRVGPSWMDPMVLFLRKDISPQDKLEANKVRRKAPRFWLSKMWTPRSLSGKTLSPDSGSLILSSWTMTFSLIANLSGDTVVT